MPERSFDSPKYRYGFNGKEKDESGEWGSLTHYDYGFRIYNPGIGRFLSTDPLAPDYPELTPYQFASNSPIAGVDLDGLEFLDADESLVNITVGATSLKMENVTGFTRARQRNSRSFTYFDIGANQYVLASNFDYNIADGYVAINDKINIARSGYAGPLRSSETSNGAKRDYEQNPKQVSSKTRRKTYAKNLKKNGNYPGQKGIPLAPPVSPGRGAGRGAGVVAVVGLINEGALIYINHKVNQDYQIADGQIPFVVQAIDIVNAATEVPDLIPDRFMTDKYRSELANYVLQGTFVLDHTDEVKNELEKVAIKIILQDTGVGVNKQGSYEKVNESKVDRP